MSSLRLEDFLPAYPYFGDNPDNELYNIYDDEPENVFYRKKEFYENRLPVLETRPEGPGIPLKVQQNLAKFMSSHTLNDEILLFHGLGSGKTCTAATIAEYIRSLKPSRKPTLVLVKGGPLRRNFIREVATRCTAGKYIPENYSLLTKGERTIRLNRLVSSAYEIHTFETFAKGISKYSEEHIKKEYSHRDIIIDEVHHIRVQKKRREGVNIYEQIHRLLHLVEDRKIILMSATPMRDQPEEFANIMNLILPVSKQFPTDREFFNTYFDNNNKLINAEELKQRLRGRVSYLRSMETGLLKVFDGDLYRDMRKIKILPLMMGSHQNIGYTTAYNEDIGTEEKDPSKISEEDEEKKPQGLYDKSRQASLFVFPDGSYGSEGFKKYVRESAGQYSLISSFRDILTGNGKASIGAIIENIRIHSAIYAETIEYILKNPKQNIFVYNKYVQGSGAILFAELLKLVGFERTRGQFQITNDGSNRRPRFALITGETVSESEIDRVIDGLFNDPRNMHGEYIQVVIGSQLIGEGKSLKNIRQIHIQTPHWNNSETEQAIGRGIRAFSHDDLPPEERSVYVMRHAAIPLDGLESINYVMYKTSEDKDMVMRQIERVCKEVAVDCGLNKDRNLLATDINGSRECDYRNCYYTCDYEEGEFSDENLIYDTYNLFYANTEIAALIGVMKELFRRRFYYDLTELVKYFGEFSTMVVVRTLKQIIDKNIPLVNKYGFPCYLREDHNLYFLVDEVTLPSSFLLSYYTENPNVKPIYNFQEVIRDLQYKYIEDKIYIINNLDPKKEAEQKEIVKQLESMAPPLKELFVEQALTGNKIGITEGRALRDLIIEHFRNFIFELPNRTVVTLLQDEEGKYRCLDKEEESKMEWKDCPEAVELKIENYAQEEKTNLENNPYGYYGIMAKKFKKYPFKIWKNEKTKLRKDGKVDNRKIGRGSVCLEQVPSTRIIDIIEDLNKDRMNVKPPIIIEMKDRAKFIEEIRGRTDKYTKKALGEMDDERLKSIYYWYTKASKNDLCNSLQSWFTENNLMLYER